MGSGFVRRQVQWGQAMKEPLYTLICDYRGGTVILQCRSGSLAGLVKLVKARECICDAGGLAVNNETLFDIDIDPLFVPIAGTKNTWGYTAFVGDNGLHVTVVKTSEEG
jgi:hypothetical protein